LSKFYEKIGKIPSVILTFLIVTVGWSIFRIENIGDAFIFISRLFTFDFQSIIPIQSPHFYVTLAVALIFAFIVLFPFGKKLQNTVFYTDFSKKQHLAVWSISMFLLIFCLAALNATDFSPFIYFRF